MIQTKVLPKVEMLFLTINLRHPLMIYMFTLQYQTLDLNFQRAMLIDYLSLFH